ncbi:MAG TPA: DNA polymerase III subunit gamma/tau [Candidatus Saccharimonadales bacterium]|nr:DNA polymerase III subunit gamma/tau [Candidatus Saccharimonadales bacterium]
MVFYRKYRPQKIEDLDSQAVRQTLTSVLSQNPPHAFLFTGPKGLGKTSAARIIAKVVNCTGRQLTVNNLQSTKEKSNVKGQLSNFDSIEPCNKCEQCISITNGTNMDILEIDAASNRGIDEIRDLKEKIRLAPMSASKKVYIIDEVHMLTTEAFNALLKTLEEPPSHAMFILCTTEPQKVPDTILSRCLHIAFKPATEEELIRSFKRIVKEEKIDIADDALKYVANLSDRGFRDGAKILEEVSSLSGGKKITIQLMEEKYHASSSAVYVTKMLDALGKKDIKAALKIVESMVEQGFDIKYFITQLIDVLHEILLIKTDVIANEEKNINDFSIDQLIVLFELLSGAQLDAKAAVLPQLPLELAIIDYGLQNYTESSGATPEQNQQLGDGNQRISAYGSASISDMRKQDGNIKKIKAMYGPAKQDSVIEKTPTQPSGELLHTSATGTLSSEWLDTFWKSIISEMKNYNHTVAGVLRGAKIGSFDKKTLVIETSFKFHKERLSDMKTITELSRIAKMLTGKDVTVEVQLRRD